MLVYRLKGLSSLGKKAMMGFCSSDTEVDVKLVPNLQPMERITILQKLLFLLCHFVFANYLLSQIWLKIFIKFR
jgi:hypothetical protein